MTKNLYVGALFTAAPPVVDQISLAAQCNKIREEVSELNDEIEADDKQKMAIEAWDVVTSVSTFLRNLQEAGVDIGAARDAMYAKNEERAYYTKFKRKDWGKCPTTSV